MKKVAEIRCGGCRYFNFEAITDPERGECRAHPPGTVNTGKRDVMTTVFPVVHRGEDWCGEWRAHE